VVDAEPPPARDPVPGILQEFDSTLVLLAESFALTIDACEIRGRTDIVAMLLRGRQDLAQLRANLHRFIGATK
jgi:hypothetical protein